MAFSRDTLRTFLAVLDHGSFSAAARQLGRVPSAVSMAVSQLEAELDLVLFDRSTRKALPTPAALALEPQARQAASQLNLLDAHALQLHQGLERRLSLAMAPELQSGPWSRPLASLAREFPALEVEVRSAPQAEAIRLLHAGEVQLALVFERPGIDEREAFQEAGSQVLVAVAAPDFAPGPWTSGRWPRGGRSSSPAARPRPRTRRSSWPTASGSATATWRRWSWCRPASAGPTCPNPWWRRWWLVDRWKRCASTT